MAGSAEQHGLLGSALDEECACLAALQGGQAGAGVRGRDSVSGGGVGAGPGIAQGTLRYNAVDAEAGGRGSGLPGWQCGVFNGTGAFPEVDAQYLSLVRELSTQGLLYVHQLDHSAMGAPPVPAALKAQLRSAFKGPYILAGGFDGANAEKVLAEGRADLIAFGRPFLVNLDLLARMRSEATLNAPDMGTLYTPCANGYTDYPSMAA